MVQEPLGLGNICSTSADRGTGTQKGEESSRSLQRVDEYKGQCGAGLDSEQRVCILWLWVLRGARVRQPQMEQGWAGESLCYGG